MTKELSEFETAIQHTKQQFLASAKRATTELDKRRKRLMSDIERANKRAHNARVQLQKKTERLANTTARKAQRELKKQIRALEKTLDNAKKDAKRFRNDLKPVMGDLVSARDHLAHALRIDKALARVRKELKRKPTKKKAAAKKAPARKKAAQKPATAKRGPTKKKAASRKPAGKKAVSRKAAAKEAMPPASVAMTAAPPANRQAVPDTPRTSARGLMCTARCGHNRDGQTLTNPEIPWLAGCTCALHSAGPRSYSTRRGPGLHRTCAP